MEIEDLEIRDYLAQCVPLNILDNAALDHITRSVEISYVKRGATLLKAGDTNQTLYLIRSGALEVFDTDNSLFSRFDTSDWFGYKSLMRDGIVNRLVKASEDCLLYEIPATIFHDLLKKHRPIRRYFSQKKPERLRHASAHIQDQNKNRLITKQVQDLTYGYPLLAESNTPIQQAAQLMTEKHVTAMLIMEQKKLVGIVTDRAFCTHVVAEGLDLQQPIHTIMSPDIMTLPPDALGSEASLMMARYNIRHIPIMEQQKVLGMITATDLIRQQSHNAIYLINQIYRAESVAELSHLSTQLPQTLVNLVRNSLTAYDIGHALSSIGESIAKRLLMMAEEKYGAPPVPYAFIIAGSQARNEQTAHSDQDSAMIISDDFEAEKHDAYFKKLAEFVADGLNECGYIYCPGDVMASNQQWRQPLATWQHYFATWINEPELKALMYASIFFDLRCIHGESQLLDELRTEVLAQTKTNSIFLEYMAKNALQYKPPLGLFRHLILEKHGEEKKALNMKKRGVTPLIDLARVYALEAGVLALNTQNRLEAACDAGALSKDGMADLRDTFEFIGTVRLQHQAAQIEQGVEPDNFILPEHLSSLERRHLKDAFEVVRTMQTALERRH